MLSRDNLARERGSARIVALVLCVAIACGAVTHSVRAQSVDGSPTESDIAAAIDKLKADPNLAQETKRRVPRWESEDEPDEPSDFGRWIRNFFVWLGQLSRVLIWVVGGLLALALLIAVYRMIRGIKVSDLKKLEAPPTHVRDLDIRPESLPDDIGAAALALWERGEHRAALALLYRGLLSRLVHIHQLPIRDSTTEGDCLALATKLLQPDRRDYVARVIRVWQHATYGGHDPQAPEVVALCSDFAPALAPPSEGPRT